MDNIVPNLIKPKEDDFYDINEFNQNSVDTETAVAALLALIKALEGSTVLSLDEVKQLIAVHTSRTDNPHAVTAAQLGILRESGTFTPVLSLGAETVIPLSAAWGRYTREGNLVYFALDITVAEHSVTGQPLVPRVSGLPFPPHTGLGAVYDASSVAAINTAFPGSVRYWALRNGDTHIVAVRDRRIGVIPSPIPTLNEYTAGMRLLVEGVYPVA
jgi:hypothetical protein